MKSRKKKVGDCSGEVRRWYDDDGALEEVRISAPNGDEVTIMVSGLFVGIDDSYDGGIECECPNETERDRLIEGTITRIASGATTYERLREFVGLEYQFGLLEE